MSGETTEAICERAIILADEIFEQSHITGREARASILLRALVLRLAGNGGNDER